MERLSGQVDILLDPDSRWCRSCTVLEEIEPEAHEATCEDCRASDLNRDVIMDDPLFCRLWRARQLKAAGIPVLDLVTELDDALLIQVIEAAIQRNEDEQRAAQRAAKNAAEGDE